MISSPAPSLSLSDTREIQIRIGQGQNLPWLPLQDLFHEYPCHPLMHLYPFQSGVFGFHAEEGLVSSKDRFGPHTHARQIAG